MSTLATAMTAHGYFKIRGAGPHLSVGALRSSAAVFFQVFGLFGLSQTLPSFQIPVDVSFSSKDVSIRCPFDFTPSPSDPVHAMGRISRHSNLWSFGSISLGSALASSSMPQSMFFICPLAVALIGGKLREGLKLCN